MRKAALVSRRGVPRCLALVPWLATVLLLFAAVGCGANWSYTGDHPDKYNYALTISPPSPIVTEGETVHLTAATPWGGDAVWTVLPASAGTLDQSGNFTAGTVPGSCTIVAMWKKDVRYTATATLTIVALPAVPITTSTPAPALGQPFTASVLPQGNSTYQWVVVGGTIVSGQGTSSIQILPTILGTIQIEVTVTDAAGDSFTQTDTLVVVAPLPVIQYLPSTELLTIGQPVATIQPTSSGGTPVSWGISPALPAGLLFDISSGQITGTPTLLKPAAPFTVTATNSGGSGTTVLSLGVVDIPPSIHYSPSVYSFVRGSAIAGIVPTNTGGSSANWSVAPTLPAGLAFNPANGIITGTPATPVAAADYTVTASNTGGTSNAAVLSIAVIDTAPIFFYIPAAEVFTLGTAISPLQPTLTHGTATAWSISPALPSGLLFDPATGIVSGTPAALSPALTYTVTASNSYGSSSTAPLAITVLDRIPVIHYSPSTASLTRGVSVPPLIPINTGGAALSWSISPALPAGLSFNTSTGAISGTPTALTPSALYTVLATNSGGTGAPAMVSLVVVDAPPSIGYSPSSFIFTRGQPITPVIPANSGGAATAWSISPSLPVGLVFDPSSGTISGTPTVLAPQGSYTVIASNTGGASTPLGLTVTVVDVLPVVSYAASSYVFTVGSPSTIPLPANTGGPAISWSLAPALPAGLTFNGNTGQINGTASAVSPTTLYDLTATNTGGTSQAFPFTLNVVPAANASLTTSNATPLYGATVTLTPTFSGAVSASVGTTQGGSDVSAAPVSGVGIVTAATTSAKTYWLRATNAAGDHVDTSVAVSPQTVAVLPISPAAPTRTVSTATTFSTTATGGTTNGLTWSASAGTIVAASGAWTAPATAQSVTITATANDDTAKTATTIVTVVAPGTSSIVTSTATPLYGATVTLTPTFTNATTAEVGSSRGASDISSAPVSGVGLVTPAITSGQTYWLRVTNAAGDNTDSSVAVTPQTVAISAITGAAADVSVASTTSPVATVTNAANTTVNWTATAGSFSPADTASGVSTTWTAPATAGSYTLTATSVADPTKLSTKSVLVVSLPVASSLTTSNANPLYGATVTLTPTFSGGTGSVSNGVGTVTTGVAKSSLALTAPTTFTLTVTNGAGQTATANSPLVTPQTVSVSVPTAAYSTVSTSATQVYAATVSGASNSSVTWTATGGTFSGATWTAPATPGTYTITATSVADPTKSNSATVTVVGLPVITSFTAANPIISLNQSTTLTPVYSNGSGTAVIGTSGTGSSNVTAAASNNVAVATASLTTTTIFTLTVYNAAGSSTSAALTVTVVTGSSTPTASLSGPLYAQTSTLLPNGQVLIAGGRSDLAPLSSAQIFDPTAAAFSSAGTMAYARYGHTATLLANNTVLLAGGNNGATTAQSELWNGSFAGTGALNTPREKHTATLLQNGQVLVVGGLNGSSPVVTAELYNPLTGAFTYTTGNLNTARYSHTATLLANGYVLIAGGYTGSATLSSAELYNPATGAFTVTGSMATARQRHAAVLLSDGTVAVIDGEGSSAALKSIETYNSGTSTFTAVAASMTNARDSLTATLLASGKVLVAGGINGSTLVPQTEIFDPTPRTSALSALLATPRTQHTATLLQSGKVLLAGGLASSGSTATAELVDPQDGLTPVLPNAVITAPVGATRAQAGLSATLPSQTHVQYTWMITGGSITAGQGTNAVTFTMPASGTATLDALITSDRLVPSHAQVVVTPKPVIDSFAAARPTVTVGSSTTLNWAVEDASSLSINQGIGPVTGTSTPVTVNTVGSNSYTLTATNAGGSVTATTAILAVSPPVATSLTAAAGTVPVGGNTTLTPIFSQGTGAIDNGVGAVSSGPAYPTSAISASTTFTLTVTNAAGDIAQQSVTVGVQPVQVTAITGPQYVSAGHAGAYAATVTGAVNTAVTWSASAGTIDSSGNFTAPTGAPYSTTQTAVTVTATSVRGGTPASSTVQVVPLPTITSFTSSPATASYGGSTTMTPVFTLGTGQIAGIGSVNSGQSVASGTLTAAKTFTLTVTDLAGDAVSRALTVDQSVVSVSTPSPTAETVTVGDVVQFSASTSGSSNNTVTWSATGGSFTGSTGTWTAPAAGTYTVTASAVSPTGYSAATTVTVVNPPTIASFTAAASTVPSGSSTNLTATFAGGTATVTPGPIAPVTGTAFSTGALTNSTSYVLTVVNAANTPVTVTQSLNVNVIKGLATTLATTMAGGRVGHTVTLLADGNVLIAGGNASTTADKFTASGATIGPLGSAMQAIRFYHTATLLADGTVLLAGGSTGSVAQNTAEIFNPSSGTFTATAGNMTTPRQKHTASLMPDGTVFLSGGLDESGVALDTAEIYDPVAGTFTAASSMAAPREFGTSTALQSGGVLIAGGDDTSTASSQAQVFSGGSYAAYSLLHARTQHTATILQNGSVFLAAGNALPGALGSTEFFNAGSTPPGPSLVTARYGHGATLLSSGEVLVTGGTDGSSALTSEELLDSGHTVFYPTGALNTARFEPAATILRSGKVLIAGGASNPSSPQGTALNSAELFDSQDGFGSSLPDGTLTAPSSALPGASGLVASVPAPVNQQIGRTYVWSITGGLITAGLNTNAITFTQGTSSAAVLNVLVISNRQVPVHSSATIALAPAINSFTASPSPSTVGAPSTLAWSVIGGSGLTLTIDNGVGDVTSDGGAISITTPASSTTYTLTATDVNGTATATVTLTAVPAPVISSLVAAVNPVQKGASTTIVPTFTTDGTASINNSIGVVASGVAYPTGTLNSATVFTLTVINSAGTAATQALTLNVMPVAVSAINGPANVQVSSASAQYTATVTGAVNTSVTWTVSAGSITAAGQLTAPATAQDIVVTATSVADPTQQLQLTVHVVPAAQATGITAAFNPVLYGGSTTITPQFTQGTGAIDQGIGTVTAGTAYTTGVITAAKTFTLTVTSPSGNQVTFPYTVNPQTVVVSAITGPASGKVTQGYAANFSATVIGAVVTTLTWSATGGTFAGAVWTAPATPGTYTITATAVNGATNTLSETVVAAPAITAFAGTPPGINQNQSSTLTATFTGAGTGSNATGVVTPGSLPLTTGSAGVSTGSLAATTTYTLTVTDDAGDTATASTSVQVFLGAWSATTDGLAPGRNLPTASLLPGGNVLVAGGGPASRATDLFNTSSLTFSSGSSLLLAGRNGHTATLLPNGLVLLAGGTGSAGTLNTAELYTPSTGSFAYSGNLAQARTNHNAILLNTGKVLLVGGTGQNKAELFNPATGTFALTGSMETVRQSPTLSLLPDGRVLVAGGWNGSAALQSAEIFDPSTGTFSATGNMLHARYLQSATTLPSGQVLIAGGTGGVGTGSAEIFNASLQRFVATGDMVKPRQQHTATLLASGMVLIAGGNSGLSSAAIDQAELFNPAAGAFLKTDFMSTTGVPVTGAAATLLQTGAALVTGGTTDGTTAASGSELYTSTDGLAAPPADATVTAATYVAQAATAVPAHVTAVANARYLWMVTNGTLVSGQNSASITFNMAATGNATLDVLILTNTAVPSHGTALVTGEPAPQITSFTAGQTTVPYGGSTTLTPTFVNGLGGSVIGTGAAGTSDVSTSAPSGVAVPVGPLTAPVQYRLTVTNRAAVSVNQTVTVSVQSVIVSAVTPANSTVSVNGAQTFSATVTQAVNTGIVWTANGGTINSSTGAWTAPTTPGNYTITATAAANGSTASSTTVTVVALPAIQSFSASPASVNYGQAASLTPVFTGASGNVASIGTSGAGSSQLSASAASGTALSTGALAASTTYTLTATNAAGATATASTQVLVVQPFSATGDMALARLGQTTTLLPDGTTLVAGGTGAADKAEIYAASGGSFTYTQPMVAARSGHTATLLPTGQVLIAGGSSGSGGSASKSTAELFNPADGSFTATGSMAVARQNHAAALLPNGSVLIAGGSNSAQSPLATAEIYDPVAGTFTAVAGSMASARTFATATALMDGRVLIAGGFNGTSYLSTAEVFASGAFASPAVAMGSARSHHVAVLEPSGQVLLAGGYDGSSRLASAVLFTPGSPDAFAATGSLSSGREDAVAALLASGKVLIAGGTNGSSSMASAEVFSSGTFAGSGNMTAARSGAGATLLLGGTVLVDGGTSDGTTPLASAEIYNAQDGLVPFQPSAIITTSQTHAPAGTAGLTATVPSHASNRFVWVAGQGTITAGQGTASITFTMPLSGDTLLSVLVLSDDSLPAAGRATVTGDAAAQIATRQSRPAAVPSLNPSPPTTTSSPHFSPGARMNMARQGQSMTPMASGLILIAGGTGSAAPGELYDPHARTFTLTLASMREARKHHTATLLADDTVLLAGGWNGLDTLSTAEIYNPSSQTFRSVGNMLHPRQNHAAVLLADGRVLLVGGANREEHELASAEIYDPATERFSPLATSLVEAREYLTATSLPSGEVLVAGGIGSSNKPLSSAELYAAGGFDARTFPMHFARAHHTATLLPSGDVVLIGGSDGFGPLASAELYTGGATGASFSVSPGSMDTAREQHIATLLADGDVLVAAGIDRGEVLDSAEILHPALLSFSSAGDLATPRFGATAALLPDGHVLLLGGTGSKNSAPLASSEEFDPQDGVTPTPR